MIYLDSCALLKLIRTEDHSDVLITHVTRSPVALLSSELAHV